MRISVLGPVRIETDRGPVRLGGPKQRTVAALLIAEVGRRVSTDALLQGVYGDDVPDGGRRSVQTYVSNLRRDVGDAILPASGGYVLDVPSESVDAVRFELAVRSAVTRLDSEPETVGAALRAALGLWRGHAYADVPPDGAIAVEVTRLHELRLVAIEARVDADLALGRHAQVLGELEALTTEHPLRERFHAQRVLALYRADRQADALHAVGEVRSLLVDELGIDPSDELKGLERRILSQDPTLRVAERSVERATVLVCDLDPDHWDLRDSAGLLRRRDDVLAAHAARIDVQLDTHGSAVVVSTAEVADAVELAAALARSGTRMRIALDHGEVERERDGELRGPPVTRAARTLALGHPGQVLLTAAAQSALSRQATAGHTVTSLGSHDVRGLHEPLVLFELGGEGMPGPFPVLRHDRLPPPIALPGTSALPGHELRRELRRDVMGAVHLAYQPAVGRQVEVRLLPPGVAANAGAIQTFDVEAQRLARLTHPHVVGLLDHWRDGENAVLVHRHVEGTPLPALLEDRPPSPDDRLVLLEQLAAALEHAHARGVLHGRLRASDVVVDEGGSPWLRDLGIGQTCTSVPGVWLHDLAPPEVLAGGTPTVATDVHGFGMLAHHVLSAAAPPADSGLPPIGAQVDDVITTATATDPASRFASVAEALVALQRATGRPPRPPAGAVVRNPYRGLETFTELDAPDFHGREGLAEELLEVLRAQGMVAAVGPSGIGKSSAVRAGLVPAVRRGRLGPGDWLVTDLSPGDDPLQRLVAALRRVSAELPDGLERRLRAEPDGLAAIVVEALPEDATLLLVVDQFEELFTGHVDERERRVFLDLLVGCVATDGPVRVVVTLRADSFDRPLEYAPFGELLRRTLVPVRAPDAGELAAIVRRPGEGVGVRVEDSLVTRIVADAVGQIGALPLVEHVLAELFETRSGQSLSEADYDRAGGLHGAIGRRAEHVLAELTDAQRSLVRPLMLELVNVDEDGTVTRRRTAVTDLASRAPSADVAAIVERFAEARLLTTDRDPTTRTPTVEVAHEALLREWPRLAEWVDDAHDALVHRNRLEVAAAEWRATGHDDSALLRGGRLELAEALLEDRAATIPDDVRTYVTTSRRREDERLRAERSRRRRTTGVLAGVLVVALALGGLARVQTIRAEAAAAESRASDLATRAEQEVDNDPEEALLLALEAVDLARAYGGAALPAARSALVTAVQSSRVRWRVSDAGNHLAVSPDGSVLATTEVASDAGSEADRTVTLRDAASGEVVRRILLDRPTTALSFVDDTTVAVAIPTADGARDVNVALVDVASGAVVRELLGTVGGFDGFTTGGAGRYLASFSFGGHASTIWDIRTGEEVPLPVPDHVVLFTDPAGTQLVTATADTWQLVDLETGRRGPVVATEQAAGYAATPEYVVHAGNRDMVVYDAVSGEELWRATQPSPTGTARFIDDHRIVRSDGDGRTLVLDARSGETTWWPGTAGGIMEYGFDVHGEVLYGLSESGEIVAIDATRTGPAAAGAVQVAAPVNLLFPGTEGRLGAVVSSGGAESYDIVDVATGESRRVVDAAAERTRVSADGATRAWTDADGVSHLVAGGDTVPLGECDQVRNVSVGGRYAMVTRSCAEGTTLPRIVDTRTGDSVVEFGADDYLLTAAIVDASPLGGLAIVDVFGVDFDAYRLIDLDERRVLADFPPLVPEGYGFGAALSPDGRWAAFGSQSGTLGVVDVAAIVASGSFDPDRHVRYLDSGGSTVALSLSVADGLVAVGSRDGRVHVYDAATLDVVLEFEATPGTESPVMIQDGTLFYGDGDVIRRVPLDLSEQVRIAEALVTRGWTSRECEVHRIEDCPVADGA